MIGVAIKWVPGRAEVNDSGVVTTDDRFGGVSLADQAALELALSISQNEPVRIVCIGPDSAESSLRDALAVGASEAVHLVCPDQPSSIEVADLLSENFRGCSLVLCGDYSSDRGSGSVPAFIAHKMNASQALGVVGLETKDGSITCTRRLDGGRREIVKLTTSVDRPGVISVEGSIANLRRASLQSTLAARNAVIKRLDISVHAATLGEISRFRPPTRVISAPEGASALSRVKQLTDTSTAKSRGELVNLSPVAAADRILSAMRDWGYLES